MILITETKHFTKVLEDAKAESDDKFSSLMGCLERLSFNEEDRAILMPDTFGEDGDGFYFVRQRNTSSPYSTEEKWETYGNGGVVPHNGLFNIHT